MNSYIYTQWGQNSPDVFYDYHHVWAWLSRLDPSRVCTGNSCSFGSFLMWFGLALHQHLRAGEGGWGAGGRGGCVFLCMPHVLLPLHCRDGTTFWPGFLTRTLEAEPFSASQLVIPLSRYGLTKLFQGLNSSKGFESILGHLSIPCSTKIIRSSKKNQGPKNEQMKIFCTPAVSVMITYSVLW